MLNYRFRETFFRNRKAFIILPAFLLLSAVMFITLFELSMEGDFEGLYLLKSKSTRPLEIRDSLYLGEADRVIAKIELPWLHSLLSHSSANLNEPNISYKWNSSGGHGYILSEYPDGSKFLVCLGRFLDSQGKRPKGLFIGGEMPSHIYGPSNILLNETGIAYKKGNRWNHIWCNANEAIASAQHPDIPIYPSDWGYKGSRIIAANSDKIALESSHEVALDGSPMEVKRFLYHKATYTNVILALKFTNRGNKPAPFYYVYGDEPWVGNYGTSKGNAGWTEGKVFEYSAVVNPLVSNIAGYADIGNNQIPSERGKAFTGLANYMAWYGLVRPQVVYFSNKEGEVHDESEKIVLDSPQNRVIFAQWAAPPLNPGQSATIILALGLISPENFSIPPRQPDIRVPWDILNKYGYSQ